MWKKKQKTWYRKYTMFNFTFIRIICQNFQMENMMVSVLSKPLTFEINYAYHEWCFRFLFSAFWYLFGFSKWWVKLSIYILKFWFREGGKIHVDTQNHIFEINAKNCFNKMKPYLKKTAFHCIDQNYTHESCIFWNFIQDLKRSLKVKK